MTKMELELYNLKIKKKLSNRPKFEKSAKYSYSILNKVKLKKCNRKNLGIYSVFGISDYYYEKNGEKIFVEIKCNNDCLRKSQLQWILNNPKKRVIIAWFDVKYKKRSKKEEEDNTKNYLKKIGAI